MNNNDLLKEITQMKEQQNDLVRRVEALLLDKHTENSNAIDDIVVAMLGGESNNV